MKLVTPSLIALAFLGALALVAAPAPAADKINVLIIDGQNNHGWAKTTPVIKDMLEKNGKFTVDVLTSPPKPDPKKPMTDAEKKAAEEGWAKFRPDFTKYQVVFSNYNGQDWPAEVNAAFEKYMQNGGGLVIFHAANNSFTKWTEWAKMVALLWQGAPNGDRITVDDSGKIVRTPKGEGIGAGHGPQHPYELVVRDKEHPITKGMPEKLMHVKDELYQGQRGPGENMDILMTAFAFILGCVPLARASGAGAAARQVMGFAVIGGMMAASFLAIFLIPVTFYVVEKLGGTKHEPAPAATPPPAQGHANGGGQ